MIVKSSRRFVCSSSGGAGVLAGAGPGAADAGPVPSGDLHSGPVPGAGIGIQPPPVVTSSPVIRSLRFY